MAEGVAASVAVVGGVGQGANADAVENDPDDAVKRGHGVSRLAGGKNVPWRPAARDP